MLGTTVRFDPRPSLRVLAWAGLSMLVVPPVPVAAQPAVVIEVNQTAPPTDDYITWAATPCVARLTGGAGPAMPPIAVVLTNDPAAAIPTGGDVRFGTFPVPAGATATSATLTLSLPQDGTPRPFAIAGLFGKPSTNDKDAVIEAHRGTAAGPILGRHRLMVRVRKNANALTPAERNRFLAALRTLHMVGGNYAVYQQIHGLAMASPEAHNGPAFLPWHRALVLRLERDLQAIDPSVTIPYWKFDDPAPNVFNANFMGANAAGNPNVSFAAANPLNGWTIEGLTPLQRSPLRNHLGDPPVLSDAATLTPSLYFQIASGTQVGFLRMEGDPHGPAHTWVGGWMGVIPTAVRDPVFFLLHTNVDRLWARWQRQYNRFGLTPSDYRPSGSYVPDGGFHIGHFLQDTMWPWNDRTGDPGTPGDPNDNRPASAPGTPFPVPPPPANGPPPQPRPANVIDYIGRTSPARLGYGYDDTPF